MALTPVAVLMFRFNNPDALLTLLMVGAGRRDPARRRRHSRADRAPATRSAGSPSAAPWSGSPS